MTSRSDFNFETEDMKSYFDEDIAVIKIKSRVFETITDLAESGKLFSLILGAERIPDVKALVIMNSPGCMADSEYDAFLKRILDRGIDPYAPEESQGVVQRIDRTREINILNRAILHLAEFRKMTFFCLQGEIVTPFFGVSLAVDFRFAAEDVRFSLPHLKYGLHPTGALPFFLQHFIGRGKTIEILFREKKIDLQEALDLGLVNAAFPTQDFEKRCLEEVKRLCHLDTRVIHTTKMLINYSRKELRSYFDIESALLH
jgi:enoyl-CoA hydratase/carnithine racemase